MKILIITLIAIAPLFGVRFTLNEVLHDREFQEDMCVGGFLTLVGFKAMGLLTERTEEWEFYEPADTLSGYMSWSEKRIVENPSKFPLKLIAGIIAVGIAEYSYIKPDPKEARGIETGAFLTIQALILWETIKTTILK